MSRPAGILFLLVLVSLSCTPANRSAATNQIEAPPTAGPAPSSTPIITSRNIDFEGVSFTYDPSVFGDVVREMVPEHRLEEADQRPDGVEPEHVQFAFERPNREYAIAELAVFPLNKFPEMYAKDPYSVKWIKEKTAALKEVLKNKDYRLDDEIPHLRFADASLDFFMNVHHFTFDGGRGVIFVTHWNTEQSLISNRNLIYRFEGITNDGKWYVTAEMPVRVGVLPDMEPEEFEGFKWEDRMQAGERSKEYLEMIISRVASVKPEEYDPPLSKFEEIISSLKIRK